MLRGVIKQKHNQSKVYLAIKARFDSVYPSKGNKPKRNLIKTMKTQFETAEEALDSLNPIIEAIDETLTCGIFACVAMGSVTIEFASSNVKGDEDKEVAKKKVAAWMVENGVTLENEADAFRCTAQEGWAIESDWWTTDEF